MIENISNNPKQILNDICNSFLVLTSKCQTGIILIKMSTILKLRNFSKRLHILIVYCPIQRKEGNMTILGLRYFCFFNFLIQKLFRKIQAMIVLLLGTCPININRILLCVSYLKGGEIFETLRNSNKKIASANR